MTQTFTGQPATPIKKPREDRYTTLHAMADLRRNWFAHYDGNLSTICREGHPLAGYPVGSVVPFILDDQSRPIVLIAHIAEHTQNALANPKASLFLRERAGGDVQTEWRICAIGDLEPVPDVELAQLSERYYRHYPNARHYDTTHQFRFYRLSPKKFRIIMGIGDIRWIAADAPFDRPAFAQTDIDAMTAHMNDDHQAAMQKYLRNMGITDLAEQLTMTHITPWGATIKNGNSLHFLAFAEPCNNPEDVHKTLVALART